MLQRFVVRSLALLWICCWVGFVAQEHLSIYDGLHDNVDDFLVDDYNNLYCLDPNLGFTKTDASGRLQGRLLLAFPFRVQTVQNPLNLVFFSRTRQQIKWFDHKLNEIQNLSLIDFGFVTSVYAEDLQQIWLWDDIGKRLVQYHFRDKKIIKAYPFYTEDSAMVDILVYNQRLYALRLDGLRVYTFSGQLLQNFDLKHGKRLRRENDTLWVIAQNEIYRLEEGKWLEKVFQGQENAIVDKNTTAFFEQREGKFYIYPIKNFKKQ